MWKKLFQKIYGEDCELRERTFRTIVIVGCIATILAITEIFIVMQLHPLLVSALLCLLLGMGVSMFVIFKYRKYNLASSLLGIGIVGIVMPILFCLSGAVDSGSSVWLALGMIYLFLMFSGKKLACYLIFSIVMYGATYGITYFYPGLVVPMRSRGAAYVDSLFSVIAVGIISGLIIKANMIVFEKEHKLNVEQNEELERSRDAKNVFFANMSHEIRTPINAIIGLNEMIMRLNPEGETLEYAKDIEVASKMLLSQVNDILDLSQLEMQKMKLVPIEYQTKRMFRDLSDMVRMQAEKKGLALHMDIDRNLPSVLYGDEKRLKQVLLNLLDNAVKYTAEGSVSLSVQFDKVSENEISLKAAVVDTGIGIRKEDIGHIYESFNRLDEKKNKRIIGSGLGLSITKQLVDLLGGEITIDSIYTKGSIFTVIVKQKIINETPIGNVMFAQEERASGETYKPLFEAPEARILIVDDNRMNSMVASKLLSYTKMQVDVAGSGTECLEMTKKKYYHVILMDSMMPDMDGEETMKALQIQENGLCRESAVIVITGNTKAGARGEYLEQGFDGYVEKPIQGRLLEEEIMQFLPGDIIEVSETKDKADSDMGQMQRLIGKKRKKIYVTSDCACDIPADLLEEYDIRMMYLYIKTPHGRFADTREIDIDSLSRYVEEESSTAYADSVTVEEYEQFFAETLAQADSVIHISLASRSGKSYSIAQTAAKNFDHVHIIDSGQISGGQGLITLCAAKMAKEGANVKEICEKLEKKLEHINTRVIMPGADIFYQNGRARKITAKACQIFSLHPYMMMHQKKAILVALFGGSLEHAWRQAIAWTFRRKRKIDSGIVFISHVGCSVKQQEWIRREILKRVPFEQVIIQKTSFTNACNVGQKAIGIAYFTKEKQ